MHCMKAYRQPQLDGPEFRPYYDQGQAFAAVVIQQLAGVQMTTFIVTTDRAFETVRPAPFEQRLKALFLIVVEFEELIPTEAFLIELDFASSKYILVNQPLTLE